ncbi:unnamed protein product, partial [Choristocarpus tenellus]
MSAAYPDNQEEKNGAPPSDAWMQEPMRTHTPRSSCGGAGGGELVSPHHTLDLMVPRPPELGGGWGTYGDGITGGHGSFLDQSSPQPPPHSEVQAQRQVIGLGPGCGISGGNVGGGGGQRRSPNGGGGSPTLVGRSSHQQESFSPVVMHGGMGGGSGSN